MNDSADAAVSNESAATANGQPTKPPGFFGTLGPGLVTGAADDDPSGIATYSQVGAQFGYSMAWTMVSAYR